MDMRSILIKRASKVGYEIKFYYLYGFDCNNLWEMYITVKTIIFLSVARILPLKKPMSQEQPSKPSKD